MATKTEVVIPASPGVGWIRVVVRHGSCTVTVNDVVANFEGYKVTSALKVTV